MEMTTIVAESRTETGKGPIKRMRNQGSVPAIMYGKGLETRLLKISKTIIKDFMTKGLTYNTPISLSVAIDGSETNHIAFIKEMKRQPVTGETLHIDFYVVATDQKIHLPVQVNGVGKPVGIEKGGMLQQQAREIMVEGLVLDIPRFIDVDISALKIGDSLMIKDLELTDKFRVLDSMEKVLFHIMSPKKVYVE